MQAILNGRKVTGFTDGTAGNGIDVPAEFNADNFQDWILGKEGKLTQDPTLAREIRTDEIKEEVAAMVATLDWRIERAKERNDIGAEGETVGEVLREKEATRRAGNRVEAELATLTSVSEVMGHKVEVLSEDYPANPVMTRLTFMRRFTNEERKDIRAARDLGDNQNLLDFWELLQLATDVRLNDPDIGMGINMLEQAGLIGPGRAQEILNVEA